ncbi:MAG TPA: cation:proton antiporter, partial [Candidatus Thermoplasmatota archaeon]|nr:cation:proton antiporter [Candidatus Thermoplasmatota archaeon]
METGAALFRDFAVVLLAAGAVALLFYYLRQPVVLGYLLAGFVVGPFSPGPSFVNDAEVMSFLGELGIVFLLFALGLEFNLRKLKKVGAGVVLAGLLETACMIALGYGLGRAFGWAPLQSVFLGAVMSISSTTIIVKVLAERGQKDEEWAQTAFGILIIEDVLAVLILTALSSAGATGNFQPELLGSLLYKLGVFLGAALLLGLLAAPRLVDRLAFLKVEEVVVIVAASAGVGMALLAAQLGFSPGLGAFVAGALMAESPRVARVTHKIEPLRDIFTAVFFVTVGAALDPSILVTGWPLILAVTVAVVLGKIVAVTAATFIIGRPPGSALRVGMTLAQVGEFGFVIAALGVGLGVADPSLYAVAIAVCAVTAFLTPRLIAAAPGVVRALDGRLPAGLRAYLSTYRACMRRVAKSDKADPEWRAVRVNAVAASLNAAVVIAVFVAGASLSGEIQAWLADAAHPNAAALGLEWIAVSLVATPFALLWAREVNQIIANLARMAVPRRLRQTRPTQTERLLRRTFALATTLATAAFCVVAGSFLVPNILYVLMVAGVGVAVGSIVLGRSLRQFHAEVERTVDRLTRGEGATREEAMHLLEDSHAWGAGSREVVLPAVSGGAGRTIGQLRLRELTGASVARIGRADGAVVAAPAPHDRFAAGDRVILLGEDAALTRAEEVLLGRDLGVEGGATEIEVRKGGPHAGKRLAA